jgi:hypothetical protein
MARKRLITHRYVLLTRSSANRRWTVVDRAESKLEAIFAAEMIWRRMLPLHVWVDVRIERQN